MTLLVLASAAAVARIVAAQLGFVAPVRLGFAMIVIVVTVRAMDMGFLRFAFRLIHSANRCQCPVFSPRSHALQEPGRAPDPSGLHGAILRPWPHIVQAWKSMRCGLDLRPRGPMMRRNQYGVPE